MMDKGIYLTLLQVKPDLIAYNALLRGYRMCAHTEKAEELFLKMKKEGIEPDEVSHTERIIVHGKTGNMEKMILKLQEMKVECVSVAPSNQQQSRWTLLCHGF